jgi:hypothetical protein
VCCCVLGKRSGSGSTIEGFLWQSLTVKAVNRSQLRRRENERVLQDPPEDKYQEESHVRNDNESIMIVVANVVSIALQKTTKTHMSPAVLSGQLSS